MSGLYQRALIYLNQSGLIAQKPPEDKESDQASGISAEEQKEILADIENVVSKNKITFTDEVFAIKAQKKGIFLPAMINIFAFVLIVAAFILFQSISILQENKIHLESSSTAGILDSKLISSMKKASEDQLSAKELEINRIQDQLKSLDDEKSKLEANMDEQIEAKKKELEDKIQMELEKQRNDLKQQGISAEDIDRQIADIKKQKEIEFTKSFDDFRTQAETQRIKDEQELNSLKASFNNNLSSLSNEKASLQSQIENQETQLQELKQKQAEREMTLTSEKKAAETRLTEMTQLREREQLVNDQIFGMYNKVMQSMKDGNYQAARKNIADMKTYFSDPQIVALPGIIKRRDTELFIIESLSSLMDSEVSKREFDSAGILQKAGLITSISKKVGEADLLYQKNDLAGAKQLYEEALAIIPEISKSSSKNYEIDIARLDQQFAALKTSGDGFFRTRDFSSALDHYKKALRLYPGETARVDEVISRIIETGNQLVGKIAASPDDERAAALVIAKAEKNYALLKYPEAIDAYLEVITRYQRTTYVSIAAAALSESIIKERAIVLAQHEASIASKNEIIAERDASIAQLNTLIENDKTALSEKDRQIGELSAGFNTTSGVPVTDDKTISALRMEVEQYKETIADKDETIARLTASMQKSGSTAATTSEKDTLIQQLTMENEKYNSLIKEKDKTIAELKLKIEKGTTTTSEKDKDDLIGVLNREIDSYKVLLKEKDETITRLNASLKTTKPSSGDNKEEFTRLTQVENELNKRITQLETENARLTKELALAKEKNPSSTTSVPDTILAEFNTLKSKIETLKKIYREYTQKEDALLKEKGVVAYLSSKPLLGEMLNSDFARELFPDLFERIKKFDTALSQDERMFGREKGIEEIVEAINGRLTLQRDKRPSDYWRELRASHKNDDVFLDCIDVLQDMMEK